MLNPAGAWRVAAPPPLPCRRLATRPASPPLALQQSPYITNSISLPFSPSVQGRRSLERRAPNRMKPRAGVPAASRTRIGSMGLALLSAGYECVMKSLTPAEAGEVWQRCRLSNSQGGEERVSRRGGAKRGEERVRTGSLGPPGGAPFGAETPSLLGTAPRSGGLVEACVVESRSGGNGSRGGRRAGDEGTWGNSRSTTGSTLCQKCTSEVGFRAASERLQKGK